MILLFGAWLRLNDIGADPFGEDQDRISSLASNIANGSKLPLLGPRMSSGSLKHSPLSIYLYSLPYRLDNDPHIARIFTALMNIVAVAIVHLIGTRYFGRIAGLLATFFFAINPAAVHSSRFIWNPNLAAPFAMLFLFTTLRGYYEHKPLSRFAHLPLLCLAGQCHPSLFLTAPVALAAWIHAWRDPTVIRQRLVTHTILSGTLALAIMVPWGIGMYSHLNTLEYLQPLATGSTSEWQLSTSHVFAALSGSFGVYAQDIPSLPALGFLTYCASAWLLARGFCRRDGLPGLLPLLGFFFLPLVVTILDSPYIHPLTVTLFSAHGVERNWWIWPLMGNAALIQGAFIGGVLIVRPAHGKLSWFWNWRGLLQTRHLRVPSILALAISSAILLRAHTQFDYRKDTGVWSLYEGENTLDDSSDALKYARSLALQNKQELMLLASDPPLQTSQCVNCRNWEALMLTKEDDIRVIWGDYGVPLPTNGAILLAPNNYSARPLVFSGGDTVFTWFRIVRLPFADQFKPDFPLMQPAHFSNGATVLGFLRDNPDSMPVPGNPWTLHMFWRVDTPEPEYFKLFVHLVDSNGILSQVDIPGLIPGQQRVGEHVLSQLDFQIPEGLTAPEPLFLRFGMYNDASRAVVTGTTLEQPDLLQIRGSNQPVAITKNGLSLNDISTQRQIQQGPPLTTTVTWHTPPGGTTTGLLSTTWQLKSSDNILVFEQTNEVMPNAQLDRLPGNLMATEKHILRIPTDLTPGKYRIEFYVTDTTDHSSELYFTDYIDVILRPRKFELPPMRHSLQANFGDQINLAGYSIEQTDRALTLVLHWQALGQISHDYKYFVHVWSENEIVAQADAMPDAYRYPTSWWAPNEVFSDTVTVALDNIDPAQTTVAVGLYNPADGQRLPITTTAAISVNNDSINLGGVRVP